MLVLKLFSVICVFRLCICVMKWVVLLSWVMMVVLVIFRYRFVVCVGLSFCNKVLVFWWKVVFCSVSVDMLIDNVVILGGLLWCSRVMVWCNIYWFSCGVRWKCLVVGMKVLGSMWLLLCLCRCSNSLLCSLLLFLFWVGSMCCRLSLKWFLFSVCCSWVV